MPSKNPPEWSRTPGDTTFVIALIDRVRLGAPVLMYRDAPYGASTSTRSTARAMKFPTKRKAENELKRLDTGPAYLPVVLDVPRPRPRRPRPKPIHRWLPMPLRDEPEPAPPPVVEETTPDGGGPPIGTGQLLNETWPHPRPTSAYGDEPDPTPEQLADQERQAREAAVTEHVNEQIVEIMRRYARTAKGKLYRHYCKIRAEVYEAHLVARKTKPAGETAKPARKPPQRTYDVFARAGDTAVYIGQMKARNAEEATRLAPEAFAGVEVNIGGKAEVIDAPDVIVKPTPKTTARRDKAYGKPPRPLKDVWLVIPLGQDTPARAVRGKTQGEALRNARAGAKGSRFTLIPDDGRATSLDLWISEPGKMEPQA